MSKFDMQDMEIIGMVNRAARERRAQEEESRIIEAEYVTIDEHAEVRAQVMKKAAGVAGRAAIACVFLGAIAREWVEPAFGIAATAAFFMWSVIYATR